MVRAVGIAKVIRRRVIEAVRPHARRKVAIALSGGVDSCSILAAMRIVRVRPMVVSYTPKGIESTDFKMSRSLAKKFGLEFIPVYVDMDPVTLEKYARDIIAAPCNTRLIAAGHVKVAVECLSPLISIARVARQSGCTVMFTGDQADGFFINSRWASVDYNRAKKVPEHLRVSIKEDSTPERIDEIRDHYWSLDKSCSSGVQYFGDAAGVEVVIPYRDSEIRSAFRGSTWREVNKPRMKEPIRLAFEEELRAIPTRPAPVNLHKGDSRFSIIMGEVLMRQPHLRGPWRTPRGLYNAMARGEV